jgi:hypothetical protein
MPVPLRPWQFAGSRQRRIGPRRAYCQIDVFLQPDFQRENGGIAQLVERLVRKKILEFWSDFAPFGHVWTHLLFGSNNPLVRRS